MINAIDYDVLLEDVLRWLTTSGVKLVIASVILIVYLRVIKFISKRMLKRLNAREYDRIVSNTVTLVFRYTFYALGIAGYLGYVGVDTAGIAAGIASIGVGVGLALQGALSNLAGGLLLVILRPFRLGDFIESGHHSGEVVDIKTFYTHIKTPDGKLVLIPNGSLLSGVIVNYTATGLRRCDTLLKVPTTVNFAELSNDLQEICSANILINESGVAPAVKIVDFMENAIDVSLRVWIKATNFWDVKFYLNEEIYRLLNAGNYANHIPYINVTLSEEGKK